MTTVRSGISVAGSMVRAGMVCTPGAGTNVVLARWVASASALGNYTDTSAGYETAMSFIAEGYDAMTTVADNASNAVLQACEEKGVLCVGNGIGQNEVAPTKLIAGVKLNNAATYVHSFQEYLDGTLFENAGSESFGVNYGVVALDGYYDAASCYTDEEKQFIEETMNKIASGEIDVLSMAEYKEATGA